MALDPSLPLPADHRSSPAVAVCIVGFRNAPDILSCLGALDAQTDGDYRVIVCENGGQKSFGVLRGLLPRTLSRGQPVDLILAESNLGYAGGVNRCIAAAPNAMAYWVLNPDTIPDPGTLAGLRTRLDRGDCDAAAGILYRLDGTIQSQGGRWRPLLARAESIGIHRPAADPLPAETVEARMNYLLGASMFVSHRFVDVAGPMRDDYFLYGEEIEWCLRAQKAGLRLGFAADAWVRHDQGTTTGSAAAVTARPKLPVYLDERNKILITRDHFPGRLPIAIVTSAALVVLRFLWRGAWRQAGYAFSGWAAGLRGQRGIPRWLTPSG